MQSSALLGRSNATSETALGGRHDASHETIYRTVPLRLLTGDQMTTTSDFVRRASLCVGADLAAFVEHEALPGTGIVAASLTLAAT
jgi:hypothetical protein